MAAIAFRLDASSSIGAGHLVRCATLGKELATRGAQVVFVIRTDRESDCAWLRSEGFLVRKLADQRPLSAQADAREFADAVRDLGRLDWIVVDHYELGASWQTAVRPATDKVLVIDDLADRRHDCDLLLDQNLLDEDEQPYAGLVPPTASILSGPRYALLRPEFSQLRAGLEPRHGAVRSVLVCFGGADPNNHTSAAIEAIEPLAPSLEKVTVVIGPACIHADVIANAVRRTHGCDLRVAPANLPELLLQSDLAIGAGGTMAWERACLGVPTVAVGIARNQVRVLERLFEKGCALGIPEMIEPDVLAMRELISVAIKSAALLAGMARRAAMLVDGEGVHRVVEAMVPNPVVFRPATMADADAILLWRNHPAVRLVSLDTREIGPADHRRWMERALSDPRHILLIAECFAQPVGVVRFDINGDVALISVYRVPGAEHRRVGLIRAASLWLRDNHRGVARIVAEIKCDNRASYNGFRSAGYHESKRELVMEINS
jgi:UDP-2,4-diacetamido-2,4,6-trideoxy-beta-L-altropyranose hydrolase